MTIEKIACPILNKNSPAEKKSEVFVEFKSFQSEENGQTIVRGNVPYSIMCSEYHGKKCDITGRVCIYSQWKSLKR